MTPDARPAAVRAELPLGLAIARVGQWLRHYDALDPRLPTLREYFVCVSTGQAVPRGLSSSWLAEWEEFLGLGPRPLRQRAVGQLCDRCDFQGPPIVSQEVKGYGHRATCPQCGEAWAARALSRDEAAAIVSRAREAPAPAPDLVAAFKRHGR